MLDEILEKLKFIDNIEKESFSKKKGFNSNVYFLENDIVVKSYLKQDKHSFFKDKYKSMLWEVEINKYLTKYGINVPEIIDYSDSSVENPVLVMKKLKAKPFMEIVIDYEEKYKKEFENEKYIQFYNLFSKNEKKINRLGLNNYDSELFNNVMFNENGTKIFFYDFERWNLNRYLFLQMDSNFKNEFPLIFENSKYLNKFYYKIVNFFM